MFDAPVPIRSALTGLIYPINDPRALVRLLVINAIGRMFMARRKELKALATLVI